MTLREALAERREAYRAFRELPDSERRDCLRSALLAVDVRLLALLKEAPFKIADPLKAAMRTRPAAHPVRLDREGGDEEEEEILELLLCGIDEADPRAAFRAFERFRATQAVLWRELGESEEEMPLTGLPDRWIGGNRDGARAPGGAREGELVGMPFDDEEGDWGEPVGEAAKPVSTPQDQVLGVGEAVSSEPEEAALVETRRTPHLDLSACSPLEPGSSFEVTVWVDRSAAREGEESEDVSIRAPVDVERFEVEIWLLASEHFEILRTADEPLVIERSVARSEPMRFRLRVRTTEEIQALVDRKELPSPAHGWIKAAFYYGHRPSGRVARRVEIAWEQEVAAPDGFGPPPPEGPTAHNLQVDATAERPDLLVHVLRDEDEPDRRFTCRVETPLIELDLEERTGRWVLGRAVAEVVGSYMSQFTESGASRPERLAALRGAGVKLFKAAPPVFQKIWWKLVDAGHTPRELAIVTEEPYLPWELMIPRRRNPESGHTEIQEPLGVTAAVGRFVRRDSVSGRQRIPLSHSHLVAPTYKGRRKLEHAEEEIALIAEHFPGEPIRPVTFANLEHRLAEQPASLVHFACHGKQTDGVTQAIYLDDEKTLTSVQVSGMFDVLETFSRTRPLVFLNACQVGRLAPSLLGVEGFAEAFLSLEARAVVAPLWSVKDNVAHEVAMTFYREVAETLATPFAEILRSLRAKAYSGEDEGEDSYAAYCFYGDPLAVRGPSGVP